MNTKIMNTTTKAIALILMVSLISCSTKKDNELSDDFRQQKEELVEGFEKLEADIDDAIDDIEDKLNINEGPVERGLEEAKADLEKKKKDIQHSLTRTKNATNDNWESIKEETSVIFDDIESGFNKLKKDLDSKVKEITD